MCINTHGAQVVSWCIMVVNPSAVDPVRLPRRRLSRAEQNEAKRRLLLASALEVLTEQGYQAMSLEEVAERAGFTRRPIYTLFGSKEQLALALFEEQIARFSNDVLLSLQPERTLEGALKRLAEVHSELTTGAAYRPLYELQIALNGVALRDEVIHQEFIRFLHEQHERLVVWLTQISDSTGQRFRLPVDRVASVVEAGFNGLIALGYLEPSYHQAELKHSLLMGLVAD
jgi:AcrR family transcriptional regulator